MLFTNVEILSPGDTVELVGDRWPSEYQGRRGVIASRSGTYVTFEGTEEEFTLAGWFISEGWELFRVSEREAETPEVSYYQFPGGVEVRDISAHLMSFPSQILQYAARSGRVDGNCKSEDVADKIRDFEKIIDFARWEIDRLEADV